MHMLYRVNVSRLASPKTRNLREARKLAREWSTTPHFGEDVTVTRLSDGEIVAGYQRGKPLYYKPATPAPVAGVKGV